MRKPRSFFFFVLSLGLAVAALSVSPASRATAVRGGDPLEFDSCTSVLVGRLASIDGSTMTSHSCDSGTDRTWMTIIPNARHKAGETAKVYYEPKRTKGPGDPDRLETGEIPQVAETYAYLNAAYPIMNEHQLAIGETTIGSRRELVSDKGIIDAPELYRLVLERARTAREAIRVADELTRTYGYNDWGECFTFADPKEVWHFEIHGPGKGKIGAVWAAQRVPDDEIGVSANAGRIREIDLADPDFFMASGNVLTLAEEMTAIEALPDGRARNRNADGSFRDLTGDEPVSMNMWGFRPQVFEQIRTEFQVFLRDNAANPKAEFYIPTAITGMIRRGVARCRILPTTSAWFGVTYREDKPGVVESIRGLIREGRYPERLWA